MFVIAGSDWTYIVDAFAFLLHCLSFEASLRSTSHNTQTSWTVSTESSAFEQLLFRFKGARGTF